MEKLIVYTECVKCRTKDSFVCTLNAKKTINSEAFCLSCGLYYGVVEKQLNETDLEKLRKEYERGF